MYSLVRVALAQTRTDTSVLGKALNPIISNVVIPVVGFMFALATLVFVYGVLKMVYSGEDETKRKEGKDAMLYGIIGMFIMVSAWGIIYFISGSIFEFLGRK